MATNSNVNLADLEKLLNGLKEVQDKREAGEYYPKANISFGENTERNKALRDEIMQKQLSLDNFTKHRSDKYKASEDAGLLEKVFAPIMAPVVAAMDTPIGTALERLSVGAIRSFFGDPTYDEEFLQDSTSGNKGVDTAADLAGQLMGMYLLYSQAGGISSGAATTANIAAPALSRLPMWLQNAAKGVGTAGVVHGLHSIGAPDEHKPTGKDFAQRALWMGLTPTIASPIARQIDNLGLQHSSRTLLNPVVQQGLTGAAAGGIAGIATLPLQDDINSIGDAAKSVGMDALTMGLLYAGSAASKPGALKNRQERARESLNKSLNEAEQLRKVHNNLKPRSNSPEEIQAISKARDDLKKQVLDKIDEGYRHAVELGLKNSNPQKWRAGWEKALTLKSGSGITPRPNVAGAGGVAPRSQPTPSNANQVQVGQLPTASTSPNIAPVGTESQIGANIPTGLQTTPESPVLTQEGNSLVSLGTNFVNAYQEFKAAQESKELTDDIKNKFLNTGNSLKEFIQQQEGGLARSRELPTLIQGLQQSGVGLGDFQLALQEHTKAPDVAVDFDEVPASTDQTLPAETTVQIQEEPAIESPQYGTVSQIIDSNDIYEYDGDRGTLRLDGQQVVLDTAKGRLYELGYIGDVAEKDIAELGLKPAGIEVGEDGEVTIDGVTYINRFSDPNQAIVRDADDNVISVNLETPDGQKRTFRGERAEEIAYSYSQLGLQDAEDPLQSVQEQIRHGTDQPQRIVLPEPTQPDSLIPADPASIQAGDVVYDPRGKEFTVDEIDSARGLLRVTDTRGVKTSLGVNVAKALPVEAPERAGDEIETALREISAGEQSSLETATTGSQVENPNIVEAVAVEQPPTLQTTEPAVAETPDRIIEPTGSTSTAYTPEGTRIDTAFEVVNSNELVTSDMEGYPQELQPRDRSRIASELQIDNMARDLTPARLGDSPDAGSGSPIVGNDSIVESGNGRVMAIRKAFEDPNKLQEYKQWLMDNAEQFGLDSQTIASMDEPVLVRVRTNEVDRVRFTEEANKPPVATMSAVEQAQADVKSLTGELLDSFVPSESGRIDTADNNNFITKFFSEIVGTTERAEYLSADGQLNRAGVERVQNAIISKAYGDNVHTLTKLLESRDDATKRITAGLLNNAGKIAQLKDGMEQGKYHDVDITVELTNAVDKFDQLKRDGVTINDFLAQVEFPGMESLSDLEKLILTKLDEFGGRGGSQKRVTGFISNYVTLTKELGDPNQELLPGFANEPPTKEEIVQAASDRLAMDLQLFAQGGQGDGEYNAEDWAELLQNFAEGTEIVQESQGSGTVIDQQATGRTPSEEPRKIAEQPVTDPKYLRRFWATAKEQGLSNEEAKAIWTDVTGKESTKDGTVADYNNVYSALRSPDAKTMAGEPLGTQPQEALLSEVPPSETLPREEISSPEQIREAMPNLIRPTPTRQEVKDQIVEDGYDKNPKAALEKMSKQVEEVEKSEGTVVELVNSFGEPAYDWVSPVEGRIMHAPKMRPIESDLDLFIDRPSIWEFALGFPRDVIGTAITDRARIAKTQENRFVGEYAKMYLDGIKGLDNDDLHELLVSREEGKPLSPKLQKAGDMLEKFFEETADEFGIPKERRIEGYVPRILQAVDQGTFWHDSIPNELHFSAEKQRTGELLPRETNLTKIVASYLRQGARKKFMTPIVNETNRMLAYEGIVDPGNTVFNSALGENAEVEHRLGSYLVKTSDAQGASHIHSLAKIEPENRVFNVPSEGEAKRSPAHQGKIESEVKRIMSRYKEPPEGLEKTLREELEHALQYEEYIHKITRPADKYRKAVLQEYTSHLLGRPGFEEGLVNSTIAKIAEVFGKEYKGRHAKNASTFVANLTYVGTMGYNLNSALRNLSQQMLSFGKLAGEYGTTKALTAFAKAHHARYTETGRELLNKYCWVKHSREYLEGLSLQENVMRNFFDKASDSSFYLFRKADTINVDTSFLTKLYLDLEKGVDFEKAIYDANQHTLDTQFGYGTDSPVWFRGPMGRHILMLATWPLNYARLLGKEIGDRNYGALLGILLAQYVYAYVAEKVTGIDHSTTKPHEILIGGANRFMGEDSSPTLDTVSAAYKAMLARIENKDPRIIDEATDGFLKSLRPYVPFSTAYRRLAEGIKIASNDFKKTDKFGRVEYQMTPGETWRSMIGSTVERQERWELGRAFDDAIRKYADPSVRGSISYAEYQNQAQDIHKRMQQLGMDSEKEATQALSRMKRDYYNNFWNDFNDGNTKGIRNASVALAKMGITNADIRRSGSSRGLTPAQVHSAETAFVQSLRNNK